MRVPGWLLSAPLGWVLRHLVLLTAVVFVLIGFYYREPIFGIQPAGKAVVEPSPEVDPVPMEEGQPPDSGAAMDQGPDSAAPPEASPDTTYRFRPMEQKDSDPGVDAGQLKEAARRAYWNDDRAGAEQFYEQLVKTSPGDPDAYGELGNVRYQRGDLAGAAEAYRQAIRLLQQSDPDRARQLMEILGSIGQGPVARQDPVSGNGHSGEPLNPPTPE